MKKKFTESRKIMTGDLTPAMLEEYARRRIAYTDETIRMYWERAINGKTYEKLGEEFGMSRQMAKKRLDKLVGEVNQFLREDR